MRGCLTFLGVVFLILLLLGILGVLGSIGAIIGAIAVPNFLEASSVGLRSQPYFDTWHRTSFLAPFFLLAVLLLLVLLVVAMISALFRGGSKQDRKREAADGRMMQELYQGFDKLCERVEALETILIGRSRRR